MASSRDRTPANNTGNDYYLPGRPPSWLRPSISSNTQPDFHSLDCSMDILFQIIQHIRRHPLHTEPMPNQTYFQDYRAYNILYQLRRDMMLMDRLVDSIYQARRLLQFVPGEPGLPGQYRIDPSARLSSSNLAALHNTPPGFPLPRTQSDRSPSPTPRTPPEDAQRFLHYWTGPPPRANHDLGQTTDHRPRERSRSRDTHAD